uniref:ATTAP1 n=1 Tax=Arundo donax TaxID=35708 RepID=A0A0A9DXD6_ARUDO
MGYSDLRKRSADEGREAGVHDPAVRGDEAPHPPERGDRRGPAPLGAAASFPSLLAVLEAPPAAAG